MALCAASVIIVFIGLAAFGPLIAPHNPYDLTAFSLMDSLKPPVWLEGGSTQFILGADDQGRDILSVSVVIALLATPLKDLWMSMVRSEVLEEKQVMLYRQFPSEFHLPQPMPWLIKIPCTFQLFYYFAFFLS